MVALGVKPPKESRLTERAFGTITEAMRPPISEATRAKMRASRLGRKSSPETRRKIGDAHRKHGEAGHGPDWKFRSVEYATYASARSRCTNPKATSYHNYGGRGIEFQFNSYEEFLACVGRRPVGYSLDRIDPNGHYAPGNVCWASRAEQVRNRRLEASYREIARLRARVTELETLLAG